MEYPPEDWPEDQDYQLHRAMEQLASMMERREANASTRNRRQ